MEARLKRIQKQELQDPCLWSQFGVELRRPGGGRPAVSARGRVGCWLQGSDCSEVWSGNRGEAAISYREEPLRAGRVLGGVELDEGKNVGCGRLGWGPQGL